MCTCVGKALISATMDQRYPLPELPGVPLAPLGPEANTVIRVFLVNGESRSLRLDESADVNVSG